MHFNEIEEITIEILQQASGRFLLPYQIFNRIMSQDPALGQRIQQEYPVQTGNPTMGEGAGIYYSPASFVAHAVNHFHNNNEVYPLIEKRWLDTSDIEIEGIIPSSQEGTSIWAWDPITN